MALCKLSSGGSPLPLPRGEGSFFIYLPLVSPETSLPWQRLGQCSSACLPCRGGPGVGKALEEEVPGVATWGGGGQTFSEPTLCSD